MWDVVVESSTHLSREMPCRWCGHSLHRYLPCSDLCDCRGHGRSYDPRDRGAGR